MKPPATKPPEEYAGKPVELLSAAIERAIAQGGLAGDRALLDQLRREIAAIRSEVTKPATLPPVFRGKRQAAFEAIVRGCTTAEAAKEAGLSTRQVERYCKEPSFVAAVAEVRRERREAALVKLEDLQAPALRVLSAILHDPLSSDRDKIAAAKEILDRSGLPARGVIEFVSGQPSPVATLPDEELSRRREEVETRLRILEGGKA